MKEYITKENKAALEAELHELATVKRKEVIAAIEYAKSLGDLSENAEYHIAREEQAKLQDRIAMIEQLLKNAEVIEHVGDTVTVGSTVVIQKEGESHTRTFSIVGSEETDMLSGKISYKSPLGNVLFGRKKNDRVSVHTPKGEAHYLIVDVK